MSKGKRGPYGPRKPKVDAPVAEAPVSVEVPEGIVAVAEPPQDDGTTMTTTEYPQDSREAELNAREAALARREAALATEEAELHEPQPLAGPNTPVRKYDVRAGSGPKDRMPEPWTCMAVDESEAIRMFVDYRHIKDSHMFQFRVVPAA